MRKVVVRFVGTAWWLVAMDRRVYKDQRDLSVGRIAFSVGVTRREKSGGVTGYFAAFIWDVGPPDGDQPLGAATYEVQECCLRWIAIREPSTEHAG
jgi:hypothetical protein